MCSGDFVATWKAHAEDGSLDLIADGYQNDDQSIHPMLLQINIYKNPDNLDKSIYRWCFFPGSAHDTVLRDKEKISLMTRVMHHFLRSKGSRLASNVVITACNMLLGSYKGKHYHEILDAAMTATDIFIHLPDDEEEKNSLVAWGIEEVAQALATLGRHLDAGNIYLETVKYCTSDLMHEPWLLYAAAIYFTSGSDFAMAEAVFLKSLQVSFVHSGNRLVFDPQLGTRDIIEEFLEGYFRWASVMSVEEENAFPARAFGVCLATLLTVAGFNVGVGSLFDKALPFLKTKFRTKHEAMSVLDEAIQSPDVASFREIIWKCHDSRVADTYTMPNIWDRPEFRMNDCGTMRARALQTRNIKDFEALLDCGNPMCGARHLVKERTYKHCPCKRAIYCKKTCQRAAWEQHKHYCTYYAETQKKKKKKKQQQQKQKKKKKKKQQKKN